jgi:hypothetical protein
MKILVLVLETSLKILGNWMQESDLNFKLIFKKSKYNQLIWMKQKLPIVKKIVLQIQRKIIEKGI